MLWLDNAHGLVVGSGQNTPEIALATWSSGSSHFSTSFVAAWSIPPLKICHQQRQGRPQYRNGGLTHCRKQSLDESNIGIYSNPNCGGFVQIFENSCHIPQRRRRLGLNDFIAANAYFKGPPPCCPMSYRD